MNSILNDKNILIFSPQFFGYGQEIAQKLKQFGASVDYYDERPDNDFITKAMIRVNKAFIKKKIKKYYEDIIDILAINHYDYVLFLNPEAISTKHIQKLRDFQSKAIFIIYMWDSLQNKKKTTDILPYFDKKYTFDKEDSLDTTNGFCFRPLFFLDSYSMINKKKDSPLTDLLFVGTVHSDRYELLMKIKEVCLQINLKTDFFLFFQSKILFYIQKLTNKSFRNARMEEFKFVPLQNEMLIEKIQNSKVILDIQHPDQKGLTMRTIEMIGARKKLITTNKEIMGYDFYCPSNIFWIDRRNIVLDRKFFDTEFTELDKSIYNKYSIEGWLTDVFSFGNISKLV